MREIRYDDLDALQKMVSAEFGDWGKDLEITQQLIDEFAGISGDQQWLHVEVGRARQGPFGATIAPGMLTLSILPRVRAPSTFKVVDQGNTVNYGSDGLRFLEPVRAGSKIHARSRLTDVQGHARGTRMTYEFAVHVLGNDRPSLLYKAVLLHAPPRS